MSKISSFPIITRDNTADETTEGLCPALCGDVAISGVASVSAVPSEYGVRKAINDAMVDAMSGINLGVGEGIFKDCSVTNSGKVSLKSLANNNPSRFTITDDNNGNITINYDGRSGSIITYDNQYVQGGAKQLFDTIEDFDSVSLVPASSGANAENDSTPKMSQVAVSLDGTELMYWGMRNNVAYENGLAMRHGVSTVFDGYEVIPQLSGHTASEITKIVYSTCHLFVLYSNGDLFAMGDNRSGNLGLGNKLVEYDLTQVMTGVADMKLNFRGYTSVYSIPATATASVTKLDGSVWVCGENGLGQLGLGDTTDRTSFVEITSGIIPAGVSEIYPAGVQDGTYTAGFLIDNNGVVWATGSNIRGELGVGSTLPATVTSWTQLGGSLVGKTIIKIATSIGYGISTLALASDGTVHGWGNNSYGQLGLGHTTVQLSPVQIYASSNYTSKYPTVFDTTTVKSTTHYYSPWYSANPDLTILGGWGTQWLTSGPVTNQRFHIDLGSAQVITRFLYENSHNSGANTTTGVRTFTLWGSNNAAAFATTTYGTDTDWTELTCSATEFDQHAASNVADTKYVTVTNALAYRYYAFKFANNWGAASNMGVRRIELQTTETTGTATDVKITEESVYAPYATSFVLTSEGKLLTTGANNASFGKFIGRVSTVNALKFQEITGGLDVTRFWVLKQIPYNYGIVIAQTTDNKIYSWGRVGAPYEEFTLGRSTGVVPEDIPGEILFPLSSNILTIHTTGLNTHTHHGYWMMEGGVQVILTNGDRWGMGCNLYGQLDNYGVIDKTTGGAVVLWNLTKVMPSIKVEVI